MFKPQSVIVYFCIWVGEINLAILYIYTLVKHKLYYNLPHFMFINCAVYEEFRKIKPHNYAHNVIYGAGSGFKNRPNTY